MRSSRRVKRLSSSGPCMQDPVGDRTANFVVAPRRMPLPESTRQQFAHDPIHLHPFGQPTRRRHRSKNFDLPRADIRIFCRVVQFHRVPRMARASPQTLLSISIRSIAPNVSIGRGTASVAYAAPARRRRRWEVWGSEFGVRSSGFGVWGWHSLNTQLSTELFRLSPMFTAPLLA